jgi:hypothetical protein
MKTSLKEEYAVTISTELTLEKQMANPVKKFPALHATRFS